MALTESSKERLKLALTIGVGLLIAGGMVWWWVRYERRKSQDGDAWLAEATADARNWKSDAQLVTLKGHGVAPDGHTPGLEDFQVTWEYEFTSQSLDPSHPSNVVPGAPAPRARERCYRYSVSISKIGRGTLDAHGAAIVCTTAETPTTPVRCSIRTVWDRAKARGAPVPAYAEIMLTTRQGARSWHFEIIDHAHGKTLFEIDLADDC
jgi:hypothetical protein